MASEFLLSVPLFIKSVLWRFYQGKFEFSLPFSAGSERSILVHFVRSVMNNRVQVWHDRPQIKPIHNSCPDPQIKQTIFVWLHLRIKHQLKSEEGCHRHSNAKECCYIYNNSQILPTTPSSYPCVKLKYLHSDLNKSYS
jgi:hypothetical protein